MCSRFLSTAGLLGPLILSVHVFGGDLRTVRICADPNNLPYSNQAGEGFENRIAGLLARDLGVRPEFVWWSQRESFLEHSLEEGRCDVVLGVPSSMEGASVTRPYYRSTYVFVSRKDRNLRLSSLNDDRLSQWRIGIHIVGNGYAPPAALLARRGLAANISGYSLYGEYGSPNPPARLVEAVVRRDVDVAVVWGPFAGYFARVQPVALDIVPVSPASFMALPFTYEISAAVRRDDEALKHRIDSAIGRECAAIQAVLREYGVPQIQEEKPPCA